MANFKPIRGTNTAINVVPIVDGQILFSTELTETSNSGVFYVDIGTVRKKYNWQSVNTKPNLTEVNNPITNKLFSTVVNGIVAQTTTFNANGTIDIVSTDNMSEHVIFNADGSITEQFTDSYNNVMTKTTVFNADGSITSTVHLDMNKTTFSGIQNILNAHLEKTMLAIGDEISITLTSSEVITMQILAIDQDSTHQVIFGSKYCLQTGRNMNSTNTNVGGWNSSAMRTYLNQSFYATLPDDVTAYIAERTVQYSSGNGGTSLVAATDKIWLPREKEVFGAVSLSTSTEGATCSQFPIYATSANRIKTMGVSGAISYWWESSPSIFSGSPTTHFCFVSTDGSASIDSASLAHGVVPCFQLIATA